MFVMKRQYNALLQVVAAMEARLAKLERPHTVSLPVPKEAQKTYVDQNPYMPSIRTQYWEDVPLGTVINALVKTTGLHAYPEKSSTVPLNVCVPAPAPTATPKKKGRA